MIEGISNQTLTRFERVSAELANVLSEISAMPDGRTRQLLLTHACQWLWTQYRVAEGALASRIIPW